MAPGLLVKHKVSQLTIYSALGFLDTHPLLPHILLEKILTWTGFTGLLGFLFFATFQKKEAKPNPALRAEKTRTLLPFKISSL
jgi:hypothetical protein